MSCDIMDAQYIMDHLYDEKIDRIFDNRLTPKVFRLITQHIIWCDILWKNIKIVINMLKYCLRRDYTVMHPGKYESYYDYLQRIGVWQYPPTKEYYVFIAEYLISFCHNEIIEELQYALICGMGEEFLCIDSFGLWNPWYPLMKACLKKEKL